MKKFLLLFIFSLLASCVWIIYTYWLGLGVLIVGIVVHIYMSNSRWILKIRRTTPLNLAMITMLVIIAAVVCRVFLFEVFEIPSSSMENTILKGDKIFVSKIAYGPQLPSSMSEIPVLRLIAGSRQDFYTKGDRRLSGITSISRNDVIVFRMQSAVVKRCAAIPGDTIRFDDALYVNNKKVHILQEKNSYRIWFNCKSCFDKKSHYGHASLDTLMSIVYHDAINLFNSQFIDSMKIQNDPIQYPNHLLEWAKRIKQNFVVPYKGFEIKVNEENYTLYRAVINNYEGVPLKKLDGQYLVLDRPISTYTFKNNYYFMLGDNRNHSRDSRIWGFIPDSCVIGRVEYVLFSNDKMGLRTGRFLLGIN